MQEMQQMQQMQQKDNNEIQINLGEIFSLILHWWWTVAICLILGAAVGFGYGKMTEKENYQVTATYLMTTEGGNANFDAIATVINGELGFMELISQRLSDEGQNISAEQLAGNTGGYITCSYNKTNSNMTITVTTPNGELSTKIMEIVLNNFQSYIVEDMNYANMANVVALGGKMSSPVFVKSSKAVKYAIIGGGGLVFLDVLVLAIIAIADTRVKGEEDLTAKYGLPVLGKIPNFEDKDLEKGVYSYHVSKTARQDD